MFKEKDRLLGTHEINNEYLHYASDKKSVSEISKGAEEELFEDLKELNNKGYDTQIYQSDMKRFESSVRDSGIGGDAVWTGPQNTLGQDADRSRFRSLSMNNNSLNKKSSFTNKKLFQTSLPKASGKAPERFMTKRKWCRFVSLVCCLSFLGVIITVAYLFGMQSEKLNFDFANKEIRIEVTNCRVMLESCDPCSFEGLSLDYRSSITTILGKLMAGAPTYSHIISSTLLEYKVIHYDDATGCNLMLNVPSGTLLQSLSIKCTENCVMIHRTGEIKMKSLSISAERLSLNFGRTIVGALNIKALSGFVQFNDYQSLSDGNTYSRYIEVISGDILVETLASVRVKFTTASENYCLSGSLTSVATAVVSSAIESPLIGYVTQDMKNKSLFEYQWKGSFDVCNASGCDPTNILELLNFDGNIYLNVMDEIPGYVPDGRATAQGSKYGRTVDIPNEAQKKILSQRDSTIDKSLPNLIIRFTFGNFDSFSTHGHRWVYTDHPIYTIIKPWWLSFFTQGNLVLNYNDLNTYLSPGFCPYRHTFSKQNNLQVSEMLSKYLPLSLGVVSFIKNVNDPLIPDQTQPSDGFLKLSTITQFSDEWVEVEILDGDKNTYNPVLLTENYQIFLLIVASVIASFVASFRMTKALLSLIFRSFRVVREKLYHIEFYWEIYGKVSNSSRKSAVNFSVEEEESTEKMQKNLQKNFNLKLSTKTSDLPSTTAFVDYLIMELWTSSFYSLKRFYAIAFEEEELDRIVDIETQNLQNDHVLLKDLKSHYQQMCFLVGYKESELSTQSSLDLLKEKGMVLTNGESNRQYLIRITMNPSVDFSLSYLKAEKKQSSLQVFLEKFCQQTDFDEDKIPFDTFIKKYGLFCKLNHMEFVLVDHIVLKTKFGIESRTFIKEVVERDYEKIFPTHQKSVPKPILMLMRLFKGDHCCCKKKFYKLKIERVKNVNLFLAGKLKESEVGKEEFKKIARLAILEDSWWYRDVASVFIELLINSLLSVPFISLFIYQEIEHSLYSMREEYINIYGFNLYTNDIWLLPSKIFRNGLLAVMFVLFLFFWVSAIINMVGNIIRLEFPWIKAFDSNRSRFSNRGFDRFLKAYQWFFKIVSFFAILWYVCLVIIWDIAASIIKSQAYLPTASMGAAFIYMILELNNRFSRVTSESSVNLRAVFKTIWSARISIIMKKMVKYTSERDLSVVWREGYKIQTVSKENNLRQCKKNLEKVASENQRHFNFINFFFSLVHKNTSLRAHLEKVLLEPPFSFNRYTTQFLSNILFISKSFQVDKFNIEKNIKLCASVVFYYRDDIQLIPLTLGDLGENKKCSCDDSTLVNQRNECSRCEGRDYSEKQVQDCITHLKIEDNSKILVDLLDILSNLQKRRTEQVLESISKIFVDCFSAARFEHIKPCFNLMHYVVFNLVEEYDYVKPCKIFMEFMKKSVKVDMNLTDILMLYLMNDSIIVANDRGQVYDFVTATSMFKRQILTSGKNYKERRMLVKYLSLETAFMSFEPKLNKDLVMDLRADISALCENKILIPIELVWSILHIPLYFTQNNQSISNKISKHAEIANVSPDISSLIYNFSMMSDRISSSKTDFETVLRRSATFYNVKRKLDLNFKELFGVIYLMKGDTNNDYFDKVVSYILNKHHLEDMKGYLDVVLALFGSLDKHVIQRSLIPFSRFCTQSELQFQHLCTVVCSFKDIVDDDSKIIRACRELFDMISVVESENHGKLKQLFVECIRQKNSSKFKSLKENILYVNRKKAGQHTGAREFELQNMLDLLDLFFEINFGTDFKEILVKYKEFVPEFEVNSLFHLCLKLLKTINGFKVSNKEVISERIKDSFNTLGEIMIGRPNDYEQLWAMIYSSDNSSKLVALNYFGSITKQTSSSEKDRFMFHTIFIDRRVKFIRNQKEFFQKYSKYYPHKPFQFGITIIKRIFMRNFEIDKSEINRVLGILSDNIMNQNSEDYSPTNIFADMEMSKTTRFYSALMDFIINSNSSKLGNYFLEDHYEPMLHTLCFSRYCLSPNEIINRIFEQLIKNGHTKLCSLLYFFFLTVGLIQRRKINLKKLLEEEINEWVNIKPEFMEFIELYTDRESSDIVDMVYKIQSRIFYNLCTDSELQKTTSILENVLTKDFYENVRDIIVGEQPSIPYLSELFKVPLKKMKFIYILTSLKQNFKLDYAFEQLVNNADVLGILNSRGINSQELVFLLKICLNKIDYDSITDLLRLMKLDQLIIPEILINLLLIDLQVEKVPKTLRDFNKNFLVHSAIFDRLGVSKEICWAYCRVLKGDFLIFGELIEITNDSFMPQNHKYFSSILTGLIGVKNYIHRDAKIEKAIANGGLHHYSFLINTHFKRFKKGEKENSLEYAQYILQSQSRQNEFSIHSFWLPIVEIFNDTTPNKKLTPSSSKPVDQIPFLRESKDTESKESYLMNFIALYNMINIDEVIVEFIHDFAFFRNILKFLESQFANSDSNYQIQELNRSLIVFYKSIEREYRNSMKKLIKEKKIIFDYEYFDKITNPILRGMFMDACMTNTRPLNADFYLYFNKPVFQQWKEDLHRRLEDPDVKDDDKERAKIDTLTKKIEELFRGKNLMVDAFKMFVTHENVASKDYWDRKFEEVGYLDDFLDSLVDVFMRSLDQTLGLFDKLEVNESVEIEGLGESFHNTSNNEADFNDVDIDDQYSLDEESERPNLDTGNIKIGLSDSSEKFEDDPGLGVKWFGLPVYVMLGKLRKYLNMFAYDKDDKYEEILYISNSLFGVLEKNLFFVKAGKAFRKYMYLSQFNFSMGVRMRTKSTTKFVGSLFMPEVYIYTQSLCQKYFPSNESEERVIKCKVIKDIFENDRNFFPNIGIFTQFVHDETKPDSQIVDNCINLGVKKMDLSLVTQMQSKLSKREKDSNLMQEYYTLCFMADEKYKDVNSGLRSKFISKAMGGKNGKEEQNKDPTLVSIFLLSNKFYGDQRDEDVTMITEFYIDKKNGKTEKEGQPGANRNLKLDALNIQLLNDLALGKYSVLTESKNIFTEHIELATYQKIYESILHLHSSKRSYSKSVLIESLNTLSSYLSSNILNLNSVLEFVVEPSLQASSEFAPAENPGSLELRDYHVFRELGLKNHTFYHIFLLHTYTNDSRIMLIKKIIDELGIVESPKIKYIWMMLLNLCYLVIVDRDSAFSKEEFKIIAEGILGSTAQESGTEQETRNKGGREKGDFSGLFGAKENKDTDLISLIYTRISNRNKKGKTNLVIESYYNMFMKRSREVAGTSSKFTYDNNLVTCFKNFILDITGSNKKSYLVKFENESESIKKIFGVQNSSLMNVFDIINWVTTSRVGKLEMIEDNISSFFNSVTFEENLGDGQRLSELLVFIAAFLRHDTESLLNILRRFKMKEEYCYVLSYYVYISMLNNHLNKDSIFKMNLGKQCSWLLAYPLIQQVHSTIVSNVNTEVRKSLDESYQRLVNRICDVDAKELSDILGCVIPPDETRKHRILIDRDDPHKTYAFMNNCQRLFHGKVFSDFERDMNVCIDEYFGFKVQKGDGYQM